MKEFRILIIGDVIGQPGTRALFALLPSLKRETGADFTVVNGENAADGFGITPQLVQQFMSSGAQAITTGNHIWQQREIYPMLDDNPVLLRPANYPSGSPGKGLCVVEVKGVKVAVVNLQGRVRMTPIDCPFKKGKEVVRKARAETPIILVDMHADAPEEKEALAWHLDGEISALVGTHTHIQSADERILPNGTAYLTDLGASGPRHSIIGFDAGIGIQRNLTQMPLKNEVSKNNAWVRGALIRVNPDTGKALGIERIAQLSSV